MISTIQRLTLAPRAILTLLSVYAPAYSRSEIVKEGMSYFSDDYTQIDGIKDLAEDKNIEEVYQFYTYYEARYDSSSRVILFKRYKQGEVILEERYLYEGNSSTQGTKEVLAEGKEPQLIKIGT
ncbi:MAG: hypothetical protein CMQ20_12260 [Gammaproteobacteria bacterium]|nr:hypothetical protein [Gammaproteobacteria bacterium]